MVKVLVCASVAVVPLVLAAWVPPTGSPLARQAILAVWGIGATLVCERLCFSDSAAGAARFVGFAPSRGPIVLAALLITLPMWLFLPVSAVFTGTPISIRSNWPEILLGVVLVNGITEEVIHRGFVFHHLRRYRSFAAAAAIGAAFFAAQHLYLLLTIGVIAGLSSVVLALVVAWPFSYAFESGGRSIIAPAILHTGSNAPMLIFTAAGEPMTPLLVPYMGVVLLSLCAMFLYRPAPADVESSDHGGTARPQGARPQHRHLDR